jgi:glutathione peroxidase
MSENIYQFKVQGPNNQTVSLNDYKNKTLLIVNVASKCGFTPQYTDLEAIYKEYQSQGLEILAFPCNQFGGQEPGDAQEIRNFCTLNYNVSFPIFAKIDVNGTNAEPLFTYLKNALPGIFGLTNIKWNFTKFLIDKTGKPISRYAPTDKPYDILKDIKKIL